jgi:hypothetical protein
MNQRGGSLGPRSRLSATRSSPLPVVPGAWSGPGRLGPAAGSSLGAGPATSYHPGSLPATVGPFAPSRADLRQRAQPRRQSPGGIRWGDFRPWPDGSWPRHASGDGRLREVRTSAMAMSTAPTFAVVGSDVDGRPVVASNVVHLVCSAGSRVSIDAALAGRCRPPCRGTVGGGSDG